VIRLATADDIAEWSALRAQLWPAESAEAHAVEAAQWMSAPDTDALLAFDSKGRLVGFVEVALRDYAEGCRSSPVGYVEGWFVIPGQRHQGVGRALIRAAEDWARAGGCVEIASDTEVGNTGAQAAHHRLGFERVGTIVVYRRSLAPTDLSRRTVDRTDTPAPRVP